MWHKLSSILFHTCLIVSFVFSFNSAAQDDLKVTKDGLTMRFAVPYFPPYIYLDENKQLTGHGINRVSKVLDKMELSYQFELVANYGVALEQLRNGKIDGFFLATQNRYRDRVAKISDSVLINNWSWFYNKTSNLDLESEHFKQTGKIGTLLNTNTQLWLQDNGYTISTLSHDVDTLVSMLINDRLDAVFLSESVFLHSLANYPEKHQKIASVTKASRDFSVYFSNEFVGSHRWFLDAFNGELAKLKANEKEAY